MSLGFTTTSMHNNQNDSRWMKVAESMRPPGASASSMPSLRRGGGGVGGGHTAPSAPTAQQSLKLRVDVLEMAVRTISDGMNALDDRLPEDDEPIAPRLNRLESEIQALQRQIDCSAPSTPEVSSVSHIRATVSKGGAVLFSNRTGDVHEDIRNESPVTLEEGFKLRLLFPQEAVEGDRVCMGAMYVDDNMALCTGWIVVCNTATGERYVQDFEM